MRDRKKHHANVPQSEHGHEDVVDRCCFVNGGIVNDKIVTYHRQCSSCIM